MLRSLAVWNRLARAPRGLALLLPLAALSAGCMISPLDGDAIPTKGSKIHCLGATQNPNDMIHVEVWNNFTFNWDVIDHAYTGTSAASAHGSKWYVWTTNIQIPQWYYWHADRKGEYALVRSRRFDGDFDYEGEELFTFTSWAWEPNRTLIDFYGEHGSDKTTARVYVD